MFGMVIVALGIVGVSVGIQSVRQEWGVLAMLVFGVAGILTTLLAPLGGLIVLVASGAVHKFVQNRRMDRIAAEADAEFRRSQSLQQNPGAWIGGPEAPPPVRSDNPFDPPRT